MSLKRLKVMTRSILAVPFLLALFALFAPIASAQSNIQTIDNPSGGEVVYGVMEDQPTMQGAMAAMLKKIHNNFGERPQIGNFFQTKDGHTVGTFFSVADKFHAGNRVTGMVMVTMPTGLKPAAAALFDNADRFKTTEPQLMKALIQAYSGNNPGAPQTQQQAPTQNQTQLQNSASSNQPSHAPSGKAGPVQPLHTAATSDNSANIGLPTGWRITGGGGGSIAADGPHGETIRMGILNQNNYDPNTQQGQNMIRYLSRGSTPFTACPPSPDLVADYRCISQAHRQRQGLPQLTLKVLNVQDLQPNQYEKRVQLVLAEIDMNDGKGPQRASIRMGLMQNSPAMWAFSVNQVNVPINLADEEWPTVSAMAASYRQNGQVIQGQTNQVIAQINAQGAANTARFNQHMKDIDQNAANFDQHMKGIDQNAANFDAHMDSIDRQSKSFQNYTLDQSVVQDNDAYARGTFSNPSADSFVQANPNRYQIVQQKDWIKGLDY